MTCPVIHRHSSDSALDEAASRYERGEHDVALACAELAARLQPASVEAHHDRALALSALGRLDQAKQAFTRALAIDPDDPETLAGAADFYINRLEPDRDLTETGLLYARRGGRTVGRRRGDRHLAASLAVLEAQALDDLSRSDEALPRVEAALTLVPNLLDAEYERAVVLFHLCQLDRAKSAFQVLLARTPEDAFVYHHLGLILERQGHDSDAEAHFARARVLMPGRFPQPVLVPSTEFRTLVDQAVAELRPEVRALIAEVTIEATDLPLLDDLLAVSPPFAPTILGLYRGTPVGETTDIDEPRTIVLYRKNLARAAATHDELAKQIRITLWHEIGHVMGHDEGELRERGLE